VITSLQHLHNFSVLAVSTGLHQATAPHHILTFPVHNLLPECIGCHLEHLLDPPEQNHVGTIHLRTSHGLVTNRYMIQKIILHHSIMPVLKVYRYTGMLRQKQGINKMHSL
jgi:hypothetical protein